jgi:hypothetical protein
VAFTEDLTQFFDVDEFAVTAVIKSWVARNSTELRTIPVIFNDPMQEVAVFGAEVETNLSFVQCRTSDLAGVTRSHTMTIGGVDYRIAGIASDGTGVSNVQLRVGS